MTQLQSHLEVNILNIYFHGSKNFCNDCTTLKSTKQLNKSRVLLLLQLPSSIHIQQSSSEGNKLQRGTHLKWKLKKRQHAEICMHFDRHPVDFQRIGLAIADHSLLLTSRPNTSSIRSINNARVASYLFLQELHFMLEA